MSQPTSDLQTQQPDHTARRTRLREFQAQLVERMQLARSSEATQSSQLGVLIGGTRCLLDLQSAGEIVSPSGITHVPLTQPWYLGLINIRGNLVSVIDFARFQGGAKTVIDKDCRIVAFSSSLGFNCALLVSRVLGLRNVTEMREHEADESQPWIGQRYLDQESHVWSELDLAKVIQQPEFLQVGL